MSSDETDSENSPVNKKRKRAQKFRSDWRNNPELKAWLTSDPSNIYKARCKVCAISMVADISVIKTHSKTSKHISNITPATTSSIRNLASFLTKPNTSLETQTKSAEIKLCGFLASHNVPFVALDHLEPLLKSCFPDSKIAGSLKLKRTKATAVVKNVIATSQKAKLVKKLKTTRFSIMTDESTDISAVKTSCLVVRFYDDDEGQIVSKFWELVQVFDQADSKSSEEGATGKRLYENLMRSFNQHQIPTENIIGFGSDGCNTMMGSRNSVASRLREECPGIFVMKCICHSLHLCASEACKALPRRCEDLARNVYNFFKSSSKRQSQFIQFQIFLNLDVHKMLHPSQTRWLSLFAVVERMIEQWEALKLFFIDKWLSERLIATEEIHVSLNDPFMKMYYLFLLWILPKFTAMNQYFQSDRTVVTELHEKMTLTYQDLLLSYLDRSYIMTTPLADICPLNASKFLPDAQLYLGVNVMNCYKEAAVIARPNLIKDFQEKCRQFLKTACSEIKKRYDFSNSTLSDLSLLTPKKALCNRQREITPSLMVLISKLPRIHPTSEIELQELDDEWRSLPLQDCLKNIENSTEPDKFWHQMSQLKHEDGDHVFQRLPQYALAALSIPHSNAECERVFSKINLIKTDTRNRLITPTVNALLLANQCVKAGKSGSCCKEFVPSDDMLRSMTAQNLYKRGQEEEDENVIADVMRSLN